MTSGVFPLPSARAPTFSGFPGCGVFDLLGSLYARHRTFLSSRDQKEGRLRAALRSEEKAGASNGKSMPVSRDPSLRSITLGECVDRRGWERRSLRRLNVAEEKLESFRRNHPKFSGSQLHSNGSLVGSGAPSLLKELLEVFGQIPGGCFFKISFSDTDIFICEIM